MNARCWVVPGLAYLAVAAFASAQSFVSLDIGATSPAGQTVVTNGGFDVSSATGDIWSWHDDFRFVYQRVTGDFDCRARIVSFVAAAQWSKAGLMVREDLSEYGANGFMIASSRSGWGGYMFTARLASFEGTYVHFQAAGDRVYYPDVWVRLVRVGDRVIPMHSTNGVVWAQIGDLEIGPLPTAAYVGMAVSNHPDSGTAKATAQFREVSLDRGTPVAPAILSQPLSLIANPGSEVSFSIVAVGRAPLQYQWFRDSETIDGATNATCRLGAVQDSDEAKYTCLLRNEGGEVRSWAGLLEVEPPGKPFDGILLERYSRVYGRPVEYMVNATNYPAWPVSRTHPSLFEVSSLGDDTGARLRGYLTPPLTGQYTFYIAADDRGVLWLSSDDNPATKQMIAVSYYWVASRAWDVYASQVSLPIQLQAGRRYYLEALIKGDGSPNQGAVGWRLPDGKFERPIPAKRFVGAPARFSAIRWPAAGRFEVQVDGTANSLYQVQASSDLVTWSPVLTNRAPFLFVEFDPPNAPQRFYRAVASP
jgi:hypothetical protein